MSSAKASLATVAYVVAIAGIAVVAFVGPPWLVVVIVALVYLVPQIVPSRRMPTPPPGRSSPDTALRGDPYASEVIGRLKADGNTVTAVELGTGPAIVGYQTTFRLRWFATRLHLFTLVIDAPQLSVTTFDACVAEANRYVTSMRGPFHFFQGGSAVVTAVRSADVSDEAKARAISQPKKRWMLLSIPLIIDTATDRTYRYAGRRAWGAAYSSWLDERVSNVFPRAGRATPVNRRS
jgi:hypothetical protein